MTYLEFVGKMVGEIVYNPVMSRYADHQSHESQLRVEVIKGSVIWVKYYFVLRNLPPDKPRYHLDLIFEGMDEPIVGGPIRFTKKAKLRVGLFSGEDDDPFAGKIPTDLLALVLTALTYNGVSYSF